MSLRLTKPGMAAVLPTHPRFGTAVGVTRSGDPIWPVAGGSDDDTDPPGSEDDDEDEEDDEEDDDPKSKKKKKDEGDDDDEETIAKWKYDKLDKRMRAADKRSSDLQGEIAELKAKIESGAKDVPDELRRELAELRTKHERAATDNTNLKVQVAFLQSNVVKWRDPEAALKLVDLDDVEIDDKGHVDTRALKSALKQLAKDKPYLVADSKTEKEDEEKTDDTDQGSGPKMNGKRKGSKETATREALAKRFPVLGRM